MLFRFQRKKIFYKLVFSHSWELLSIVHWLSRPLSREWKSSSRVEGEPQRKGRRRQGANWGTAGWMSLPGAARGATWPLSWLPLRPPPCAPVKQWAQHWMRMPAPYSGGMVIKSYKWFTLQFPMSLMTWRLAVVQSGQDCQEQLRHRRSCFQMDSLCTEIDAVLPNGSGWPGPESEMINLYFPSSWLGFLRSRTDLCPWASWNFKVVVKIWHHIELVSVDMFLFIYLLFFAWIGFKKSLRITFLKLHLKYSFNCTNNLFTIVIIILYYHPLFNSVKQGIFVNIKRALGMFQPYFIDLYLKVPVFMW